MRAEEASIVGELKTGNEDAYTRLIAQYHQAIYGLVYRILDDPADAPDVTQEVFIKTIRDISTFSGESSLKAWMYRIAIHVVSHRRRWFFHPKVRERSIEPLLDNRKDHSASLLCSLGDGSEPPFESVARRQGRARLEQVLQELPPPYRTVVILRDIEELSYEEVAEITETSLGTVKSRLVRGREALRNRLDRYAQELNQKTKVLAGEAAPTSWR
jgi:RNA polymerase sigma-70 factor (ECF subfamily)